MAPTALHSALASGLSTDDVGTVAIVVIVAIVIIGFVLGLVMNKRIGRIVLAVIVIGLAILVWTQRQSIQDRIHKCDPNVTFFGLKVHLSASDQQSCSTFTR